VNRIRFSVLILLALVALLGRALPVLASVEEAHRGCAGNHVHAQTQAAWESGETPRQMAEGECSRCQGSKKCSVCGGSGKNGSGDTCSICNGSGKCYFCNGTGKSL